jgi:hypothetical protein
VIARGVYRRTGWLVEWSFARPCWRLRVERETSSFAFLHDVPSIDTETWRNHFTWNGPLVPDLPSLLKSSQSCRHMQPPSQSHYIHVFPVRAGTAIH